MLDSQANIQKQVYHHGTEGEIKWEEETLFCLLIANGYVAGMAFNKLQSVLLAIKILVAPSH